MSRRSSRAPTLWRPSPYGTNRGATRGTLALEYRAPSGWEIHNARLDWGEGPSGDRIDHQDVRDDRVLTYFSLDAGESLALSMRFNAAYLGEYYLPTVTVEAMYDASPARVARRGCGCGWWRRGRGEGGDPLPVPGSPAPADRHLFSSRPSHSWRAAHYATPPPPSPLRRPRCPRSWKPATDRSWVPASRRTGSGASRGAIRYPGSTLPPWSPSRTSASGGTSGSTRSRWPAPRGPTCAPGGWSAAAVRSPCR